MENSNRLWYRNNTIIERKRCFEPITTAALLSSGMAGTIGTAGLASIPLLGSLFKKKQDKNVQDPLAGIRQQLLGLASGVPERIEAMKKSVRDIYARQGEEGLKDIQENVHGVRGFGSNTIEEELNKKLRESLATGEASDVANLDLKGLAMQGDILNQAAGIPYPGEAPEESNTLMNSLLTMGGNIAGQKLGADAWKDAIKELGGINTPTTSSVAPVKDPREDLLSRGRFSTPEDYENKYMRSY